MANAWKDKNGNCKCESCGRIVPKSNLKWERGLGYCSSCYVDIQRYKSKKNNY